MKLNRNIIWIAPLFFIITYPLWSIPISNFLVPRGGFDPSIKHPPQKVTQRFSLDKVKITQNQNGMKTAVIIADTAHTGQDPNLLLMDNVNADIFDDDGNITHIIAKKGEYNTVTKLLTLITDVVVNKINAKQFLYTDLLHYDNDKRTVFCPGPTRLEAKGATINGGRLNYDIKSETYIIDKRVHCILDNFIAP
ncbi:MAG: LPS export ABC transporter periplasmic protein LptC [Desulfotalea sp.]|nr:MAG: LPS export ABC transporter periplasmic protein LptC [Desulfotalea sp.]